MISELEKGVQRYWTQRSHDFGAVRRNELEDEMGRKWFRELEKHLPENGKLKILDVGTGTGFFAVLLAQAVHRVEGVDLTPAMLEEARALAARLGLDITFREMDAQALDYEDGCFDANWYRYLWDRGAEQAHARDRENLCASDVRDEMAGLDVTVF